MPFCVLCHLMKQGRTHTNEEFTWLVRNRLMLHQPQLNAVRNKKCVKGCSGILNEEHIIKCMHGPEKHVIHTQFALVINDMMKHAGCATVLELRYLVPGDGERRHTDVLAKGVKLDGSNCNRVGVDVTVRAPDFSGNNAPRRRPGVAAFAAEKEKRNTDDTEKKLRRNGVNYFPLAIESNGALGPSLTAFLRKFAAVGKRNRGHDEDKFIRQWTFVISNTVLKSVAASALTKMHQANQKTQVGMSMNYPKGVLLPTSAGERFIW